jgi:uncharacterized protein (DUF362 family)
VALAFGLGCGGEDSRGTATTATTQSQSTFGAIPQGQVTLVRADTPEQAVMRGVALMGDFSFIRPGQRVLLKPNMTGPLPPPTTTSPAVLVELIRQCYQAGAGEVIVGERTFAPLNTTGVFGYKGYEQGTKSMQMYVEEAGAAFRPFDDEPWVEVSPAGAVDFDQPIRIPQLLAEVDHFINVPAMKTHSIASFTMTMKNLFGCVHPDIRNGQVHNSPKNAGDPDRQKRMFAEMNLAFHPTVNVMDAIVSLTTGGPTPPGKKVNTNMVLLGKDRVAMDAVGLAIFQHYGTETWIADKPVWQQVQLAEAVKLGVGVRGPNEITLVGEGVDELSDIEARLRAV